MLNLDRETAVHEMRCEYVSRYEVTLCESPVLDISNGMLGDLIGGRRTLLITTPTVYRLYGKSLRRHASVRGLDIKIETVSLSEQNKSMESTLAVCALAKDHRLGRRDLIVAFG